MDESEARGSAKTLSAEPSAEPATLVVEQGLPAPSDTLAAEPRHEGQSHEPRVLERAPDGLVGLSPRERYESLDLLGEGGMGEVRLCEDRQIGRRIAMKVIRPEHAAIEALQTRFLREARVQGQLEHPAVVPVYDLGYDEAGTRFFTMKRVRGETLDDVLDRLRDGAPTPGLTTHKLLASFAQVCLTIDYAHARGVIHRDLKPANLMLGRFGEVYVLDWGLAKVLADRGPEPVDEPLEVDGQRTAVGAILGTPAYAAPEQLQGREVDARTDVWALGAILFEILTLEPLNTADTVGAMVAQAVRGLDARPSARAPHREVPPELEAICVKATAVSPSDRFASAREVHDAVERYLSGDRDRDARKKLAREHEQAARAAAEEALAGSMEARERALAEIGRAVALDPESPAATALLYELVDRAPKETPPEVEQQLEELAEENLRRTMPHGALIIAAPSVVLFLPLALWLGTKSALVTLLCVLPYLFTGALGYASYRANRLGRNQRWFVLSAAVAVACASVLVGPFFFVPALATITAGVFCAVDPRISRSYVIGLLSLAVLVPAALEWFGLGPVTHEFLPDGSLRITSSVFYLPRVPTMTLFIASSLFTIVAGGVFLGRLSSVLRAADARRLTQRWQMEQLLPGEARLSRMNARDRR